MTTALRHTMHQDLQLAGLSDRTQEAYLRAVRQLADHFHIPPDRLTEPQVRDYLLHPKNDRKIGGRIDLGGHFNSDRSPAGGTQRHMDKGSRGSHLLVVGVSNDQSPLPGSSRRAGMRTGRGGSSVTSPA